MQQRYGHFTGDGSEFVITTPDTPRNWYNYFFTDHYISFTSQVGVGQGFLQDRLGRRIVAVKERGVYLWDGTQGYSLTGLPVHDSPQAYECTHGLGYTVIRLRRHDISTEYGLFVPCGEDPLTGLELAWVKVKNLGTATKEIKLMSYCGNDLDGPYTPQGYNTDALHMDGALQGLHFALQQPWNDATEQDFRFFHSCGQGISGHDCARNAFIGSYGTLADPKAIHRGGCSGSSCVAEKMCFALERAFTLAPGEEQFSSFLMGLTDSLERAQQLSGRYGTEAAVMAALQEVKAKHAALRDSVEVHAPDRELNHLLNHWLPYQTNMGSRWARVRHNGYRDLASDTECLAAVAPRLAWDRFKRILSYQYANGYAPRTFLHGQIHDNNFADCTVWLTFTAYTLIMELGDASLLLEQVPFNDGSLASVYEHLKRSVSFLYGFTGHHGLIRIWGGDWNDCMNWAGLEGKGVSVWLSIAWYRANEQFRQLAALLEQHADVRQAEERAAVMKQRVDQHGWDEAGGYYLYAISDEGHPIGAHGSEEGAVYLNPQLWALMSGIAAGDKALRALARAEELLEDPLGTLVSTPAYTKKVPYIGGMTLKAPGVQENGGVYLHTMGWKLAVDAMLKRHDLVARDIQRILPFRNPVVQGRAEPYMLCNCYMGKETGYRYGTPGQSWRTGAAPWFLKAMLEHVLGLHPTMQGLDLRPCLPPDWHQVEVRRVFRGCSYQIRYQKTGEPGITVDGQKLDGSLLPCYPGQQVNVVLSW